MNSFANKYFSYGELRCLLLLGVDLKSVCSERMFANRGTLLKKGAYYEEYLQNRVCLPMKGAFS